MKLALSFCVSPQPASLRTCAGSMFGTMLSASSRSSLAATNAITEGRARFRIGIQWFSRSGCWNRRAPARPCGRDELAQFSLLQRFAVWWVAPPWPILSVAAVLLALCRLVVFSTVYLGPLPVARCRLLLNAAL